MDLKLTEDTLKMKETLYLKNLTDSIIHVHTTCTKIFVESCTNMNLVFADRIITSTVEIWKCSNVQMEIGTSVQTLQVDMCQNVKCSYKSTEHFNRVIWSQCEDLALHIVDNDEHKLETGSTLEAKNAPPAIKINPETDQFIVRLLPHKKTEKVKLCNELVVRLDNGFPTTEREAKEFEIRQEENLQKMARDLLGDNVIINKKKSDAPKVGRNDPCTCGSNKKFKKCCGAGASADE